MHFQNQLRLGTLLIASLAFGIPLFRRAQKLEKNMNSSDSSRPIRFFSPLRLDQLGIFLFVMTVLCIEIIWSLSKNGLNSTIGKETLPILMMCFIILVSLLVPLFAIYGSRFPMTLSDLGFETGAGKRAKVSPWTDLKAAALYMDHVMLHFKGGAPIHLWGFPGYVKFVESVRDFIPPDIRYAGLNAQALKRLEKIDFSNVRDVEIVLFPRAANCRVVYRDGRTESVGAWKTNLWAIEQKIRTRLS